MNERVLEVLQTSRGGGSAHALAVAREAARRGYDVVVAGPPGTAAPLDSVAFVPLPDAQAARAVAIARVARASRLVHAHGTRAAAWAFPALVARRSLVTFHGLHPLRRAGTTRYGFAARALMHTLVAAADAAVCVADTEAADLERLGLRRSNVVVVRNAVPPADSVDADERRRAREALDYSPDDYVVVVAARLHEQKDPLAAIEIAASMPDVLFLFAGDGELLPEVARSAPPNTRVLGHRDDVRTLLAAADVVLSTARWEGLPLGLLEAMWAGVPVVASDAPGNVEALGDAGIIVARGDAAGFRAAIERLRDASTRQTLAARARRRVAREFSFKHMLDKTLALYETVLRG